MELKLLWSLLIGFGGVFVSVVSGGGILYFNPVLQAKLSHRSVVHVLSATAMTANTVRLQRGQLNYDLSLRQVTTDVLRRLFHVSFKPAAAIVIAIDITACSSCCFCISHSPASRLMCMALLVTG